MGRMQREKGKRFEREVATRLREVLPDAKRTGFHQVSADGSLAACDVSSFPFWVEAKVGAKPPLLPALKQAQSGAPPGWHPIAVCKVDRCEPTVTMTLESFLEIAAAYMRERTA